MQYNIISEGGKEKEWHNGCERNNLETLQGLFMHVYQISV